MLLRSSLIAVTLAAGAAASANILAKIRERERLEGGGATRGDYAEHEDILGMNRADAIREAQKRYDDANKRYVEAQERIGGRGAQTAARAFEGVLSPVGGGSNRANIEAIDKAELDRKKLADLLTTLHAGVSPQEIAKRLGKSAEGVGMLFSRRVQPVSYRSVEEIRKSAQVASLSGDPFDRLLEQMRKQGDFEARSAAANEGTERNTRRAANQPPPVGP